MKYIFALFCFTLSIYGDGLSKEDIENVINTLTQSIDKKPIKIMVEHISFEEQSIFGIAGARLLSLLEKVIDDSAEYNLVKTDTTRSIKTPDCYRLKIFYNKERVLFSLQHEDKIVKEEQVYWSIANQQTLLPPNATSIAQAMKDLRDSQSEEDFQILMTTNKGKAGAMFKHGEKLILEIEVSKSCHVDIFYYQANNEIIQIFPNEYHQNNYLEAGKIYHIPDENYGFDLEVDTSEIAGFEIIKAVGSIKKLPILPGVALGMGLRGIKIKLKDIVTEVRKNDKIAEASCQILTTE